MVKPVSIVLVFVYPVRLTNWNFHMFHTRRVLRANVCAGHLMIVTTWLMTVRDTSTFKFANKFVLRVRFRGRVFALLQELFITLVILVIAHTRLQ